MKLFIETLVRGAGRASLVIGGVVAVMLILGGPVIASDNFDNNLWLLGYMPLAIIMLYRLGRGE